MNYDSFNHFTNMSYADIPSYNKILQFPNSTISSDVKIEKSLPNEIIQNLQSIINQIETNLIFSHFTASYSNEPKNTQFPSNIISLMTRDFNKEFNDLIDTVPRSVQEFETRNKAISKLTNDFNIFALSISERIIYELRFPTSEKSILPRTSSIGGLAGGSKFRVGYVLFKLAQDNNNIYGSDENAQKAISNEIVAMNAILQCKVPHLSITLSSFFHLHGHAIMATALAPIRGRDTLVYGTCDALKTFVDQKEGSPGMLYLMMQISNALNLKQHIVYSKSNSPHVCYLAADIEGHWSSDVNFVNKKENNVKYRNTLHSPNSLINDIQCTFALTGRNFLLQEWFVCNNCTQQDVSTEKNRKGCCINCAKICHKGHSLLAQQPSMFYCDCACNDLMSPCLLFNVQQDDNEGDNLTNRPSHLDGRYYIIDVSRLMPCIPPQYHGDIFYKLFRPEFLKNYCHLNPLSSDTYSLFGSDNADTYIQSVISAYQLLQSSVIPKVALELTTLPEFLSYNNSSEISLISFLHARGINFRDLNNLRNAIAINYTNFRQRILLEMISRCLKQRFRSWIREFLYSEQDLFSHLISLVFQSRKFWQDYLCIIMQKKYNDTKLLPQDCIIYFNSLSSIYYSKDLSQYLDACLPLLRLMIFQMGLSFEKNDENLKDILSSIFKKSNHYVFKFYPKIKQIVMLSEDTKNQMKFREEQLAIRSHALGSLHPSLLLDLFAILDMCRISIDDEFSESLSKGRQVVTRILQIHNNNFDQTKFNGDICRIAYFFLDFGQLDEAKKYFLLHLNESISIFPEYHHHACMAHTGLGIVFMKQQKIEESVFHFEKAFFISKEVFGADHLSVAAIASNLALSYKKLKNLQKVTELLEYVLFIYKKHIRSVESKYSIVMSNLILIYRELKEEEKIIRLLSNSLELFMKEFGNDHSSTVFIRDQLTECTSV